ncbi:hypothetical protein BPA30113_05704 [Burkholderia paludis]|uniref:Uncharacterized protein n=1 Tax=Burkholderia paludis TaxID=1506587 RepID=A0A6P2QEH0_9BURK|nr:hypothetical protein BPA30113_05704 [Burkholderia paludis]
MTTTFASTLRTSEKKPPMLSRTFLPSYATIAAPTPFKCVPADVTLCPTSYFFPAACANTSAIAFIRSPMNLAQWSSSSFSPSRITFRNFSISPA